MPPDSLVELWTEILEAKFGPGTPEEALLLGTGDSYLQELDTRADERTFWCGYVRVDGQGRWVEERGYNFMGKMLMLVRTRIRGRQASLGCR